MPLLNGTTWVLLGLCVACFASFTWAIQAIFLRTGTMPVRMKWLSGLGLAFFIAQILTMWHAQPSLNAFLIGGGLLYSMSLALFWWTVPYARRARLAVAFTKTSPATLLTRGPYRLVRHPFYSSYLLFWAAGFLATSEPLLMVPLLVMGGLYWSAIFQEERAFASGPFADAYCAYARRTGALFPIPRLRAVAPAPRRD